MAEPESKTGLSLKLKTRLGFDIFLGKNSSVSLTQLLFSALHNPQGTA